MGYTRSRFPSVTCSWECSEAFPGKPGECSPQEFLGGENIPREGGRSGTDQMLGHRKSNTPRFVAENEHDFYLFLGGSAPPLDRARRVLGSTRADPPKPQRFLLERCSSFFQLSHNSCSVPPLSPSYAPTAPFCLPAAERLCWEKRLKCHPKGDRDTAPVRICPLGHSDASAGVDPSCPSCR